ncbi:MAG: ATP-binding cassette domain-containing protein [Actinomycetota bacterium]|nr:ATP-binding cassette domain-containing protein [Actinomycetota bacterium]
MIEAEVALKLGTLDLEASMRAGSNETVVLVGPNGAGKTTMLRLLAGLLPLERGRVVVDHEVLEDTSAGIRVKTESRRIGFVFQDYLLFKHLSALDNVAFGLRAQGRGRAEARGRAQEWLERVGLGDEATTRPSALSGGQAQRVALTRALATDPRVLLLDEPLAALDATARASVRRDLIAHLRSFEGMRVVVTHDPVEAVALGDRLVVLEDGRVIQEGTAEELRERPRSAYVAELFGSNMWRGVADAGVVTLESGAELVVPGVPTGTVLVSVHPRAVALYAQRPEGSPRNVWPGIVTAIEPSGEVLRVRIEGRIPVIALVTRAARDELELGEGGAVWAAVKATEISVYPA